MTSSGFGPDVVDINGNQVASSKMSRDSSTTSLGGAHFMRGLLEVEPLHFMCCSTSDGTYVERIGAGKIKIWGYVNVDIVFLKLSFSFRLK